MRTKLKQIWQMLHQRRHWFWLGIGLKRWLLLIGVGAGIMGMGWVYLVLWLWQLGWLPRIVYDILTVQFLPSYLRVLVPLLVGSGLFLFGLGQLAGSMMAPFRSSERGLGKLLYQYKQRQRGPQVVAIGGGTGMPSLLRGIKAYTNNVIAIVTVADDGGSSGRLRRELGLLPPGDFRNNLVALAEDETLMTQLVQYRFGGRLEGEKGGELQGHAFGNLLIAALAGITGSFEQGLAAAERVLALRGRVMPSTMDEVTLVGEVLVVDEDGRERLKRVVGESAIPKAGGKVKRVLLEPEHVRAYPPVVRAILQADLIVLGPGSLYTSILPNLLVPGVAQALAQASAPKVYICNVADQKGETSGYTVSDHVYALWKHVPQSCVTVVLANNNFKGQEDGEKKKIQFVAVDEVDGAVVRSRDLVDEDKPWRHDSEKLARAVMELLWS
ncbi:MAG TPA: gluconeogenesis factor YvcK family protein [Anaerolineae bacterium]|nr:gluconeogenesis factor YvcK family protein [Anaerolineae bacterium]